MSVENRVTIEHLIALRDEVENRLNQNHKLLPDTARWAIRDGLGSIGARRLSVLRNEILQDISQRVRYDLAIAKRAGDFRRRAIELVGEMQGLHSQAIAGNKGAALELQDLQDNTTHFLRAPQRIPLLQRAFDRLAPLPGIVVGDGDQRLGNVVFLSGRRDGRPRKK